MKIHGVFGGIGKTLGVRNYRYYWIGSFISILGFINVLLTGGIGVFGAMYGLSRLWFILKEGLMPLVIGVIVLFSIKRGNPLIRTFIYNEAIFKTDIINQNLEITDQ